MKEFFTTHKAPKTKLILMAALFLCGLFYEYLACLCSVLLIASLLVDYRKNGFLLLPKTDSFYLSCFIAGMYGVSAFWAVDSGMALLGFFKFLPLPLFLLAAAQYPSETRQTWLAQLPATGVCMTVICALTRILPGSPFFVNGRLAGCFLYPNTFALFLLLGVIILVSGVRWDKATLLQLAVLLAGIGLSGSRTVFVLLLITVGAALLRKERSTRLIVGSMLAALLLISLGYVLIFNDFSALGRVLTLSLQSSTLQGRLLYWQDALPVILRHPFGLGYMGYAFLQGAFQTGVYSVTYVHNDWLQLALDVGWLPAILLIAELIRAVFSRQNDLTGRLMLTAIALHSIMDFDLQFPAIWFVLLLALDRAEHQSERIIRRSPVLPGAMLLAACLFFGTVSALYYGGAHDACVRLYPAHTQAQLARIQRAETIEEAAAIADGILPRNDSAALAWSAKARAAFYAGDMIRVIEYKERAIALARYSLEEYLDYFQMLHTGYQLYLQQGDRTSAEVCRQKLLSIPRQMEAVLQGTSPRGWRIQDQPELALPEEYQRILAELR